MTQELSGTALARQNEPLAKRTTLRIGGPADYYVEPASEEDLSRVVRLAARYHVPFILLGRGSNLLICDAGFRGLVICLAHENFSRLKFADLRVEVGAGARLKILAVEARRHQLGGLEFLEGIPGSLGGALRMNAGAMGSSLFDVVESVRTMDHDGQVRELALPEIPVEYRRCPLFKDHIALGAVLRGERAPAEVITERMNRFSAKRWESQPAAASAGCMFKNPHTIPAGKLIEELGLKGARVGGAVVSEAHGNFIVNEGNATARDVLALIELIKAKARTERGIELETEVEIVGDS